MAKTTPFFCAEASARLGEDLIGYAVTTPTYVLVECQPPWTPNALESKYLPANLKAVFAECQQAQLAIRPLLIHNPALKQANRTRVILYRQKQGFSDGYHKQEFQVSDPEAIADLLRQQLLAPTETGVVSSAESTVPESTVEIKDIETRDFLICTHGSHDQCCARFGNPFFRQAVATVKNLGCDRVRVWQVSHIGCHRFAPTAIDLPEGRYYGRLDAASFAMILTRTGDIKEFPQYYRGWGILPYAAQPIERSLLLHYGWDWFDSKVECQVLEKNAEETWHRFELSVQSPQGMVERYQAEVIDDSARMLSVQVSCNNQTCSQLSPYWVKNLVKC